MRAWDPYVMQMGARGKNIMQKGGARQKSLRTTVLKGLAVESCLGSGTVGLYRPGNLPGSRPKGNAEFSLAVEMGGCVSDWEWMLGPGCTAVRILDVGLLASSRGSVAPGTPAFLLAQSSSGVTGAAELGALFWLAALRACLLLLLRHFLGRDGVRGAPDGTLVVMADAWVSLVLRTVTETSRERTESLGIGARESLKGSGNSCPARRGWDGVGSGIQCKRLSYRVWVTPRRSLFTPVASVWRVLLWLVHSRRAIPWPFAGLAPDRARSTQLRWSWQASPSNTSWLRDVHHRGRSFTVA